jgi:hypothetical protein
MSWIKNWVVKLLGPKFIRDKVAHLLTLLNGVLVSHNIASVDQAQTLSDAAAPVLVNLALLAVSMVLSIQSTNSGK